MTQPSWVTAAGPLLRTVATTTSDAVSGTDALSVFDTTSIDVGQYVYGNGVNPQTTVISVINTVITATFTAGQSNIVASSANNLYVNQPIQFTTSLPGGNIYADTQYWINWVDEANSMFAVRQGAGNISANASGTIGIVFSSGWSTPGNVALSNPMVRTGYGVYNFATTTFLENTAINVQFVCTPGNSNNYVSYTVLNGTLPAGNLQLISTANVAYLTGTLASISANTQSVFTVRASENDSNGIVAVADRTFTMDVVDNTQPYYITRPGVLAGANITANTAGAANINNITLSNLTLSGSATFTSGSNSIAYGGVGMLAVDNIVQFVGATSGYNISNTATYWVSGVDVANSAFTVRTGANAALAPVTANFSAGLGVQIANVITVSTSPYNLSGYGLNNGSQIYVGGVSGVQDINNNQYWVGNADVTTSTFNLYSDSALTRPVTRPNIGALGTYVTDTGTVGTVSLDSVYFDTTIVADPNDPGVTGVYTLASGTLPPGLELSTTGRISGYPQPPLFNGAPTVQLSEFTVRVTTPSGSNTAIYSIPVINQELAWSANNVTPYPGRSPSLLNRAPLAQWVSTADPYYDYYFSGSSIGTVVEDNVLTFKFIGQNWNATALEGPGYGLTYTITGLTAGPNAVTAPFQSLVSPTAGVATDGWINGVLANLTAGNLDIATYNFTVTASNISAVDGSVLTSDPLNLTLTITGSVEPEITWLTEQNLGVIQTGDVSRLGVRAQFDTSVLDGQYRLVGGSLPPALRLLSNGQISGRVAFQPTSVQQTIGTSTRYTFTIEAYSVRYVGSGVTSTRTFTVDVLQVVDEPYDDIYMKALLSPQQDYAVQQLVGALRLQRAADIYRLDDPYYGVSTDVRYTHLYGVKSKTSTEFYNAYLASVQRNFYYKNITLGPLRIGRALDSDNNTIYEVVYSEVVDNLVNAQGVSVSKSITWPYPITIDDIPFNRELYPNSLDNMRQQLLETINLANSEQTLPLWMRGELPGFRAAWPICYTRPGRAAAVIEYIENYLRSVDFKLNSVNFALDRFTVDRSMSYTLGTVENFTWPNITAEFNNAKSTVLVSTTSGLQVNQPVQFVTLSGPVTLETGNITATTTSAQIVGSGTAFDGTYVGKRLYNSEFQLIGNVQSVANTTALTLVSNSAIAVTNGSYYRQTSGFNVQDNYTYYISEVRANYIDNNVVTNSIKIRPLYYSTIADSVVPNNSAKMYLSVTPLSPVVSGDSQDSYVFFDQQTILRPPSQ